MGYNERLLNEALQGNKDSFKELKFNAGSGNAEAQFFFAQYYAKTRGGLRDEDYLYWMRKSKNNGFDPANVRNIEDSSTKEVIKTKKEDTETENIFKGFLVNIMWGVIIGIPLIILLNLLDISGKEAKALKPFLTILVPIVITVVAKVVSMIRKK